MKIKLKRMLLVILLLFSFAFSQELKVGDIAPSWAMMYAPGKFEMLRTWSEEEGKRLRRPASQPYRHVVVMSFFATWCAPCMLELPILEKLYDKYKNERIKFFLVDITEGTRTMPGYEDSPKAGPFLKKKGVTMPILYDTRGVVMERYNATSLPRLYIIDGNRKITQIREGFHSEEKFTKELTDEIERLLKNV